MDARKRDLALALQELARWTDALNREAKTAVPQVRDAMDPNKPPMADAPSRGALARLILNGVEQRLDEVKAALSDLHDAIENDDRTE